MGQLKGIQKISFIGSGNVATHLAIAFKRVGLNVVEIYSPYDLHAAGFAKKLGCKSVNAPSELDPRVDLIIISIPDAKIQEAIVKLPDTDAIVGHTSGFSPLDDLVKFKNHGVLYPLQTFTKDKEIDLGNVPFCIEANNRKSKSKLIELAKSLSKRVHYLSSDERRILHLAAVMVNNFTNHIYHIAEELLEINGIDFDLLLPLINETAFKVNSIDPASAQTGPARRNDQLTISEHEKMLSKIPEYRELYHIISEQIRKKYYG